LNKKIAILVPIILLGITPNTSLPAEAQKCTIQANAGVAAGEATGYAWSKSGKAFAWGRGDWGQRGDGSTRSSVNKPVPLKVVRGVVKISSTRGHALVLQRDGKVFATGYNDEGQLGIGRVEYSHTPKQVRGLPCIVDVATGTYSAFALSSTGDVYGWGYNASGELAVGNLWPVEKPIKIPGLSKIKRIFANNYNLFAVASNGEVFGIGPNEHKQLGESLLDMTKSPVKLPSLSGVKHLSFSNGTVLAITASGMPVVVGKTNGVLADANAGADTSVPLEIPFETKASSIVAAADQTFLVDASGSLFSWGGNNFGALGNGREIFCMPMEQFGTGTCMGYGGSGLDYHVYMEKSKILSNVRSVATGDNFSVALQNNGTVWAWGSGRDGQLGNGYDYLSDVPVQTFRLNLNR
jgi:alpha-tubulin suppressor-like RCC1 family protein